MADTPPIAVTITSADVQRSIAQAFTAMGDALETAAVHMHQLTAQWVAAMSTEEVRWSLRVGAEHHRAHRDYDRDLRRRFPVSLLVGTSADRGVRRG